MTSYLVTYQIRRRASVSIYHGDWQDREEVVIASDDARDAIDAIIDTISGHEFRLRGIKVKGRVHVIAHGLR